MKSVSNRTKGDANYSKLLAYFERVGAGIPVRSDGTADIACIVRDVPLSGRGIIYQNERNRDLCNQHFALQGIPEIGTEKASFVRPGATDTDDEKRQLRKRVQQLERELSVARAEVSELRAAARRFADIEDHLAKTGRLPR
jgi:hypothetical protein